MNNEKQILSFSDHDISTFLKAVHILYYEKNQDLKSIADKYLCEFDKHQNSWDIAIDILKTENLESEVN